MRWVVMGDDLIPAPGGVAVWTARVVDGLRAAGHDVRVYGRRREGLRPGDVGVAQRSFARWGYLGLARASQHDRAAADRVLATTWHVAPPRHRGWVVAHGSDLTAASPRPRRRQRVLRRCRLGAVSAFLAGCAARLGARAEVLPAPVDAAERPRSAPVGPTRWVWAGRMVPGKGGDRFVRLVAAAGVRGTMLGDGPCRARWQALAERLGASVTFAGWRPHHEALACVQRAHALVFLPRGPEGLGLVALEAAALGVPVVACAAGGLPEAVGPGLLLSHPDDADASAQAIAQWVGPERGREAWEHVRAHHGTGRLVARLCAGPA